MDRLLVAMDLSDLDPSIDILSLNDLLSLPAVNISYDEDIQKFFDEIDVLSLEDIYVRISSTVNIQNYHFDLRSYWLIDIIAELILKGKKYALSNESLWGIIGWFVFIINGFIDQKWTHGQLLKHLYAVSIASAQEIKMRESKTSEENILEESTPQISSKESVSSIQGKLKKHTSRVGDGTSISSGRRRTKIKEENVKSILKIMKIKIKYTLNDISIIVEIFYNLFVSHFQFKLLQWSFSNIDQVVTLEWPHPINTPRLLKPPPLIPQPPLLEPHVKETSKSKKGKNFREKKGKKDKAINQVQEVPEITENPKVVEPLNWEVEDNIYIFPLREAKEIEPDFFNKLFGEEQDESKSEKSRNSNKRGKKLKAGRQK